MRVARKQWSWLCGSSCVFMCLIEWLSEVWCMEQIHGHKWSNTVKRRLRTLNRHCGIVMEIFSPIIHSAQVVDMPERSLSTRYTWPWPSAARAFEIPVCYLLPFKFVTCSLLRGHDETYSSILVNTFVHKQCPSAIVVKYNLNPEEKTIELQLISSSELFM